MSKDTLMSEIFVITIDGPAGSGKSTVAKMLADKVGARFLDTGAMYRAVTLAAMNTQTDLADQSALLEMMKRTDFKFHLQDACLEVQIDGVDATQSIRTPEVTVNVKFIAAAGEIRTELVKLQRQFADNLKRVVTEGRDQGTVAFPNADYKFFLVADVMERAKRRHAELIVKGIDANLDDIADAIEKRDESDRNRTDGPLIAAGDAIQIDSTSLDAQGVVNAMLSHIKI